MNFNCIHHKYRLIVHFFFKKHLQSITQNSKNNFLILIKKFNCMDI